MGMGQDSILSQELVHILNQKNVHLLYQASHIFPQGSIRSFWLDSTELGMVGETTTEWERYRKNLIGSCIKLVDRPNDLIWTGGDSPGQISVKNVCSALSKKLWKFKHFLQQKILYLSRLYFELFI